MNTKNRKNKLQSVTSFCDVRQVEGSDDSLRFRFSDKTVDRHGTVLMPGGVILDNYKKNRQVLFMHDNWNPTVGQVDFKSIEITPKFFDGDIIFDRANDPFAELLYHKYKNGFMNAVSVGFRAVEISDEPVAKGQKGVTVLKWELYEISLVTIGSNPNALQRADFMEEMRGFREEAEDMGYWRSEYDEIFTREDCDVHMKEVNDRHEAEIEEVRAQLLEAEERATGWRNNYTASLNEIGRLKQ